MDEEFQKKICEEIDNLERLNREMKQLVSSLGKSPRFMEIRTAASILHDFYGALEKIFERIALVVDGDLPRGEDWHIQLLSKMASPQEGIRNSVISKELMDELKEYLRFRHLFRHIYGFELTWERFSTLCLSMDTVFDEFKKELHEFTGGIE